jgi:hypothetical protein
MTTTRKRNLTTPELIDSLLNAKANNKEAFWDHVDTILEILYREYPNEMKEAEEEAFRIRSQSLNPFGETTKNLGSRFLCTFPKRLEDILSLIYGDDYQDSPYKTRKRFIKAFAKRYPQFSIPTKV